MFLQQGEPIRTESRCDVPTRFDQEQPEKREKEIIRLLLREDKMEEASFVSVLLKTKKIYNKRSKSVHFIPIQVTSNQFKC